MKSLVILNGECKNLGYLKSLSADFDKIICADGGYLHAVAAGIKVDAVVGDFDSSNLPYDVNYVVYPKEKDLSDAEIAIEYAIEHFGKDVTLTCSLGKRLDHQMFNVFLLAKYPFLKIEEVDVMAFLCTSKNIFSEFEEKTVSFLPIENAKITLKNFKYCVTEYDIKPGETVTLSNVAFKDAEIDIISGKVIAIVNKTSD